MDAALPPDDHPAPAPPDAGGILPPNLPFCVDHEEFGLRTLQHVPGVVDVTLEDVEELPCFLCGAGEAPRATRRLVPVYAPGTIGFATQADLEGAIAAAYPASDRAAMSEFVRRILGG